ncbi:MAG: hypothetical protein JWN31_1257 [Frankiales bacterium]|nr:hypothetical protein [Frankiales bacterium]
MLPTPRRIAAAATAGLLLSAFAVSPVLAAPRAAAPTSAAPLALGGKTYTGYTNGTLEYVNALNLGPDVAKAGLGQSASGVQMPAPLSTAVVRDQLKQPTLIKPTAGKTAYGHGSGGNVGLVEDVTAEPNVIEDALSEATSPAPSKDGPNSLVDVPLNPVLHASLLQTSAAANTIADGSCVTGKDLGLGDAQVTNAQVVTPDTTTAVADTGGVSETMSHERLAKVGANTGLLSESSQFLAPITLLKGTGADITIEVLGNKTITLSAQAGGANGTSTIKYGQPGATDTTPVVRITIAGTEVINLTSQQVFGTQGFILPLGVADVTIGGQAHSLTGLEGSAPTKSADGTHASAAADFIRVSVPGKLPVPGNGNVFGTGSPFEQLNAALGPVLSGLQPVTSGLQSALTGLDAVDLRIGHLEASSTVPVGGIDCSGGDNPLSESRKDVSATNVTAGQTFNYTLRIPNRGTSPITNVAVTDTYSDALQFVSSVPAPASRTGNVLKYNLGTLDPNEFATVVMTFRVPTNATPNTVYNNKATITGTYNGAPISFPVQVSGPTVVGTLGGGCNLSGSSKYASNTHVKTGENMGYFINVFNSGGTTCNNVVVKDTLISGVSFQSCNLGCTHAGQNVTWNLGSIPSGVSKTLFVLVKVTATSGRLPNTAIITTSNGTGGKPHTPGPIVDTTTVPAPGAPAILVTDNSGQLPRTGMSAAAAALGAMLLLGSGLAWRRRRVGEIG